MISPSRCPRRPRELRRPNPPQRAPPRCSYTTSWDTTRANEYGTQDWRFTIVRTAAPSRFLSRVEGVHPGGEVLLLVTGNTKVKRALLQIDALEAAGFEPADVSPAYYRHVHNRITAGRPARDYSEAQHQAHLAARGVSS